jgi:hypothetical protein
MAEFKRVADELFEETDLLLTPSTGATPLFAAGNWATANRRAKGAA